MHLYDFSQAFTTARGNKREQCAIYQSYQLDIGYHPAILKAAVKTPRLSFDASTERQRDRWQYVRMREGFIWEWDMSRGDVRCIGIPWGMVSRVVWSWDRVWHLLFSVGFCSDMGDMPVWLMYRLCMGDLACIASVSPWPTTVISIQLRSWPGSRYGCIFYNLFCTHGISRVHIYAPLWPSIVCI